MKRIICKKEYDTETATLIKKVTFGEYGDPAGYEECLMETPDGALFEYANGGEASKHPKETITRLSKKSAQEWLNTH